MIETYFDFLGVLLFLDIREYGILKDGITIVLNLFVDNERLAGDHQMFWKYLNNKNFY